MSLYNDISPQTLIALGIAVAIVFILMMLRICCDISFLRKGRKDQETRVRGLLMSNMLERLGIPLKKYFRKTTDRDKQRHIWLCEHCSRPEDCERMLLGEDIDPHSFCPNFNELEKIKRSKV